MPSRKWKLKFIYLMISAAVLLLSLWFGFDYWHRSNSVRQKVWELIDPDGPAASQYRFSSPAVSFVAINGKVARQPVTQQSNLSTVNPFQTIKEYMDEYGAEVYTYLNEFAMHRESKWMSLYRTKYFGFPIWLRNWLPRPASADLVPGHALELISRLGPIAARACAESVINGINHPDLFTRSIAVRSFWYVLPDSEAALRKFLDGVKRDNQELLGNWHRGSVLSWKWSQDFPQRLQITNGLDHVYFRKEVITALDHMGADASPAIPILIGVIKQIDAAKNHGLRMPLEGIEPFRREAVNWLAKFAENHSEVSLFLKSYIYDKNPDIRATAGRVMIEQASRTPVLDPALLRLLQEGDLNAWKVKMRSIGSIAERAKELLPGVVRFTSEDNIKSWYVDMELPYKQPLSLAHVLNMKLTACVAVGRIDSAMVVEHLPFIVEAIGLHSDPVEFLKQTTTLSESIVPLVEPYLQSPVDKKQIIAADILLHHHQEHPEAIATLKRHIKSGAEQLSRGNLGMFATNVLFKHDPARLLSNETILHLSHEGNISVAHILAKASGDFENLLPLIEQGLQSSQPEEVNKSLNILQEMENKPKQFIPLIQETLKSTHMSNSSNAFMLLLEYGTEYLPPLGQ